MAENGFVSATVVLLEGGFSYGAQMLLRKPSFGICRGEKFDVSPANKVQHVRGKKHNFISMENYIKQ